MIEYPIGESGEILRLSDDVLRRFCQHRQVKIWQKEAGGQLFAKFDGHLVDVIEATGPRPTDRRTRTRYEPDKNAEQAEIDLRFPSGLHFIGDWHTHPEDIPSPSGLNLHSTADSFQRSKHGLDAFLLVIVGRGDFPRALYVSFQDKRTLHTLCPSSSVKRKNSMHELFGPKADS